MIFNRRHHHTMTRTIQRLLLSGILLASVLLAIGQAQITLDGSLGPQGPLAGPNYRIGAELGQVRGSNLFQSFGQFNVRTGESATFTGPNTIANIVSRVTGGEPSAIDGRLRSEIAAANLYLLNPSGVLFGPNASLDVSGSFHVSTADFLRFADGAKFFANLGQESVLTVAPPAAFGFLANNPAAIALQGSSLRVETGSALSVVGGDLTMAGARLQAPSGRIQLTSVAAPGEVGFSPLELAPDLGVGSFARFGRIELSQGTVVEAIGEENQNAGALGVRAGTLTLTGGSYIDATTYGAGQGGTVTVMATEAITIAGRGSELSSTTFGRGDAGRLSVSTPLLTLVDEGRLSTATVSSGNAGPLELRAATLTLTGGARIDSSSFGAGRGGEVTVAATEAISIAGQDKAGFPSGVFSNASGSGAAGRVVVTAPTLSLMEEGAIAARTSRGGYAGEVKVQVGRLTLTGGATISTSTSGTGQGGLVTVEASEAIVIAGPGSRLSSTASSTGDAGRIVVSAPILSLMEEGEIRAGTFTQSIGHGGTIDVRVGTLTLTGGSSIHTGTGGAGGAGHVAVIATDTITIAGESPIAIAGRGPPRLPSGLFSENAGPGQGGDILVAARHIQLSDGGMIRASSAADGPAGTVLIQAGETFRSQGGLVSTVSGRSGGGAIALHAGSLVELGDRSAITTSVRGGGSDAGNLTLDAPLIVAKNSQVVANAFGGRGGNIQITAEALLADPASLIDASSALGIQGTVDIRAPVTTLSGTLAPLPQAFVSAAALLPARCTARFSGGKASSLVLGGRDGLPLDPGGVLPSPLTLDAQLAADAAMTGEHGGKTPPARFALLAVADKVFPRMRGAHLPGQAAAALDRGCPE